MPIQYLENQDQDMYALKRMGSTFSDAVVGMAEARAKRQEFIQRMMMERQYLDLAQQKEQREGASSQIRNALEQAQTGRETLGTNIMQQGVDRQNMLARLQGQRQLGGGVMDIVRDPQSGPQLMGDLRQAGVAPQGQFQMTPQELMQRIAAAVSGQTYGEAASSPASAERMSLPIETRPGAIGRNPQDPSQIMFQNPQAPIDPYHAAALQQQKDHYAAIALQHLQDLAEKKRHNVASEKQKAESGDPLGIKKAMQGDSSAAQPSGNVPKTGEVRKGYRFKGGDPSKKENWDKINE